MNEYRQKFDELYQFFAGYFHQDWSRVYDWKYENPNFINVVNHFKATNPKPIILKVRNQLEDFLQYELDETELKNILSELGSSFYPEPDGHTYRAWLEQILLMLDDPAEKGKVLREIE
jgi:hypothetical protein